MILLAKIKAASIEARKARNAKASSLLTTLLSEATMIGKNAGRDTTDAETIAVVKKFLNNNNLTLAQVTDGETISTLNEENNILNKFIPVQLSEDDIKLKLTELISELNLTGPKAMGLLLKEFKFRFEGLYDGAVASRCAKELLSQ